MTRIGIVALFEALVFVPLLAEGVLIAAVASASVGGLISFLLFREDYLIFGHTYRIGGRYESGRGAGAWVEQPGERPAHEGAVIVLVRVAGIFSPRRFIIVCDGSDGDSPFGRRIELNDDGYFVVKRQQTAVTRSKHIEGMLLLLIEETRSLHEAQRE